MQKHETNTQFIRRLMEHGIIDQVFIVEAVRKLAAAVVAHGRDQTIADFAGSMLDGAAWFAAADHILAEINNRNR